MLELSGGLELLLLSPLDLGKLDGASGPAGPMLGGGATGLPIPVADDPEPPS